MKASPTPPSKTQTRRTARKPPHLSVRFEAEQQPLLARFLPDAEPQQWGLGAEFCDLYSFLTYLQGQAFYGYLYVQHATKDGLTQEAWALALRGQVMAAAATVSAGGTPTALEHLTGQAALEALVPLYQSGGLLSAHPIESQLAQLLVGLGAEPAAHGPQEGFSGLHASPHGAELYSSGKVVATLEAELPYEATFPAPAQPAPLKLPKALAGWAHAEYTLTLRGRDALSPITEAHMELASLLARGPHQQALALLSALLEGRSPAEYALETEVPLSDLQALMTRFEELGYFA